MFKTISVIGGDLRQLTTAQLLKKDGFDIILYGFDKESESSADTRKQALQADVIILPVPVSFDGEYINAPFSSTQITVKEIAENISSASVVLGGQLRDDFCEILEQRKIKYRDYLKREELAIRNAVPTAEGAIQLAISETPITLHGSQCLVAGYGRIGKILSKMLCGMGARTSVEARNYADLALIEGHGCNALSLGELPHHIGEFDIIFNTIPALIFNRELLSKVKKNALIIDLASKPGGIDFNYAKELGLHVIWALSLPGQIAPVSAGTIIKDTITNILREMEV